MSTKKEASCSSEAELLKELRTKAQLREEANKRVRWVEMIKALPESTRDVSDLDLPHRCDFECVAQKIIESGF